MDATDSKERFSDRAKVYARHRPDYPDEAVRLILESSEDGPAADIGSGTGKLTKMLLPSGRQIYAVEPNPMMRCEAEAELSKFPNFHSVCASAEETTLPDNFAALIVAAQAFHWFDKEKCKKEFRRISTSAGVAALIWNQADACASDFMRSYLDAADIYSGDYPKHHHDLTNLKQFELFFDGNFTSRLLAWSAPINFEGLWGRALSSSYAPVEGHPHYEPLKASLEEIFSKHQKSGFVTYEYKTLVVLGKL
ncbi:MAG: class I SAM-dependent methyltransferase [Clostridiales bacterium]|nr:class I SAM-dependent methyltransferase [Clostridiales bacterium]